MAVVYLGIGWLAGIWLASLLAEPAGLWLAYAGMSFAGAFNNGCGI